MKPGILIAFMLLSFYGIHAQNPEPVKLTTPAPQSPEAAALGKYGEVPIGYYTGVPKIELPIYEIQSGTLKLPVSLSYHAGGVKVEEAATWTGLGWSLNAGGAVNRMLRGVADERPGGWLSTGHLLNQYGSLSMAQRLDYFRMLDEGSADGQPDIFSFSLTSGGGKFFYDRAGRLYTVPQSKNRIEMGAFFGKEGWNVVDQEGVQYYFTDAEESFSYSAGTFTGSGPDPSYQVSSWFLTKIISANGLDSINFEYDRLSYNNNSLASVTQNYSLHTGPCDNYQVQVNYGMTSISGVFLKRINFKNGYLFFERDNVQREDIPGTYRLKKVRLHNLAGEVIRQFELFHSYESSNADGYVPENHEYLLKRMYLDSVSQEGSAEKLNTYRYEYNYRGELPYRLSYRQDHWGYYNGPNNNTNFLPTCFFGPYMPQKYHLGDNKEPSEIYATAGTIKKITYPTGGSTEFDFELNTVSNLSSIVTSGLDLLDTTIRFQTYGDPNGLIVNYSGTFTVQRDYASSGGVIGILKLGLPGAAQYPIPPPGLNDPVITLKFPDNHVITLHHNTSLFLPVGNYEFDADFSGVTDPNLIKNFYFTLDYDYGIRSNSIKLNNTKFGGLRIKRTKDITNENVLTRRFIYSDPAGKSSGAANNFPSYLSDTILTIKNLSQDPGLIIDTLNSYVNYMQACSYLPFSSVSRIGLALTQGSTAGYSLITELVGENGEGGKNEYAFTNPASHPDILTSYIFPYAPETSFEWVRGMQLSERAYKNAGTGYAKVKEKVNNYSLVGSDTFSVNVVGFKALKNVSFTGGYAEHALFYSTETYTNKTSHPRLVSDTNRTFDQANGTLVMENVNAYDYSPYTLQPREVTTTLSGSKKSIVKSISVGDLHFSATPTQPAALAYKQLKDKNALNLQVEKSVFRQDGVAAPLLLQSVLTNYNSTVVAPDTVKVISLATPSSSFTPATITGNVLVSDNRYTNELLYEMFDPSGNVRQAVDKGGVVTTFLYGYGSVYPVAKIMGAGYVQVSGLISQGVLDAGGPTETAMKTELAKLYTPGALPSQSMVTTFMYKPLVGIRAQTDQRGRAISYEYDPIGRLEHVKDQNGHIIKKFYYSYASPSLQSEAVIHYNTLEYSGPFTRACDVGEQGSVVTYTVPVGSVSSTISIEDANLKAQLKMQNEGQAYANSQGTCSHSTIYATLEYVGWEPMGVYTQSEVFINFFSDQARTLPVSVNNLTVNYRRLQTNCSGSVMSDIPLSVTGSGTSISLGWQIVEFDNEGGNCYHREFIITDGQGYQH